MPTYDEHSESPGSRPRRGSYDEHSESPGSRPRRGSYRLTVITQDKSVLPAVKEAIAQKEATVVQEVAHGERTFVYPIQKETKGFYTSYVLESEPGKIYGLDHEAQTVEGVLRALLVHWATPKASPTPLAADKTGRLASLKSLVKDGPVTGVATAETKMKLTDAARKQDKEKPTIKPAPVEKKKLVERPKKEPAKKPTRGKKQKGVVLESDEQRLKELDEKLAEILKS